MLPEMRLWPFRRDAKREHYLGEYTEPSFRGALVMLLVSVLIVTLLWIAYSWALNQPHGPNPDGFLDGVRSALVVLPRA